MNKKAIATPLFVIFIIIILATSIFLIKSNENKEITDISFGQTSSEIMNSYLQSEKDYLFYEKLVEFNEYRTVKEFSETLPEIDSSFDFKQHFLDILNENLKEYNPEIELDNKLEIDFGQKEYKIENSRVNLIYKRSMKFTKQPIINFNELESISADGTYKIGEILNENLEKEEIYANIKIKYGTIF